MGYLMMRGYFIFFFTTLTVWAYSQNAPITNQAAKLCEAEDWLGAQQKIAEAMKTAEINTAFCWYVDGYIHKELYKTRETGQPNSTLRMRAVDSFMKSLELDDSKEHTKMSKLGLKYLASTYYNDALMLTQSFNMTGENEPTSLFGNFLTIMEIADTRTGIVRFSQEFERNMGQRYFQLWTEDVNNTQLPEKIIDRYHRVLSLDSNDVDAWYNVGVVYYNQA
ncbi:MAG: hypothetical protein ACKOW8_08435, partial [Flavobacteriales bacterium]